LQEARYFQQLSQNMLTARRQAQLAKCLHWWHLIAQDLHHHRVVLASFKARRMRRDGYAVLQEWREWAHERAQERRAIVCHWNQLLVTVRTGGLRDSEAV
jgi:hypothetical protein